VAPSWIIRRALAFVLLASALKLLDVPTATVGWVLLGVVVAAPPVWIRIRRSMRHRIAPVSTPVQEQIPVAAS
jgi:thiol:disulfide interchange protein